MFWNRKPQAVLEPTVDATPAAASPNGLEIWFSFPRRPSWVRIACECGTIHSATLTDIRGAIISIPVGYETHAKTPCDFWAEGDERPR